MADRGFAGVGQVEDVTGKGLKALYGADSLVGKIQQPHLVFAPSGGGLYVGGNDGKLYAFGEGGEASWAYDAGAPVLATVVVEREDEESLVALAAGDGTVRWVTAAGVAAAPGPVAGPGPYDGAALDWSAKDGVLQAAFVRETQRTVDYLASDPETAEQVLSRSFSNVVGFDYYFGHFTVLADGALERYGYYRQEGQVHFHHIAVDVPLEECKGVGSLGSTSVQLVCGDSLRVLTDLYSPEWQAPTLVFQDEAALAGPHYEMQLDLMNSWLVAKDHLHYFGAASHGVLDGLAFSLNLGFAEACYSNYTACTITAAETGVYYYPGRQGLYRITVTSY